MAINNLLNSAIKYKKDTCDFYRIPEELFWNLFDKFSVFRKSNSFNRDEKWSILKCGFSVEGKYFKPEIEAPNYGPDGII